MEENLAEAETLISKWDTNKSNKMLFQSNAEEVRVYMDKVENLQQLMDYLSVGGTNAAELIRAQRLIKTSMACLQNEFHKILLSNSEPIDPDRETSSRLSSHLVTEDSITNLICSDGEDDGNSHRGPSCSLTDRTPEYNIVPLDAVVDLRKIAQRMSKSGYASECVRVFALTRKSVVEESLCNLGVEEVTFENVRKMEWKFLDDKIKKWIYAAEISIRILFAREKRLCDDVFEGLDKMRDSCFAEISKESTFYLLKFAEDVIDRSREPERLFMVLDLHKALTDLMPDIDAIYCQDTCRSVYQRARRILPWLGQVAREILTEFDKAIEKENSKTTIAGGIVHPLTRYVMNYLTFLSGYKETLLNMIADAPGKLPKALPDDFTVDNPSARISARLGWTVFLLLCKLNKKSNLYKDVALSYLFLMNNLHYIVQKVNGSELKFILGEKWLRKHWNKLMLYAVKYETSVWMNLLSCLKDEEVPATEEASTGEALKERLKRFNSAMEEVKRRHTGWVVPDVGLPEKLGISITEKLIPPYTSFYSRFRSRFESDTYIKYTPKEVQDFVLDMFKGRPSSVSSTSS